MTPGNHIAKRKNGGFTMIDLLIAMSVLLIGTVGILSMHRSGVHATQFSRQATEASVLGEDKLEQLRIVPITALNNGSDTVTAQGIPDGAGPFTRTWTVTFIANVAQIRVDVGWLDQFGPAGLAFTTQRHQ